MATLAKIAIWVAGSLFLLDNAGFNVSTFIAGLGIGGVAIALAAQAILGDTFSSFAIALDKPFEVGDLINVDDLRGVVEHIGLKTTRVRSVGGELLVFANSDLTKSRIRNFKKMERRYVNLKIHADPLTPNKLLQKVPNVLAEIIAEQANVTLDYAKLALISERGFLFELNYYVNSGSFNAFADIRQNINFAILQRFEDQGIKLAFDANISLLTKKP